MRSLCAAYAQPGAELDVELEALSDRELGAEPDIEPDTEAGCTVALLDSNRCKGLNDGETLFSVQNGITKPHPPGGQSLVISAWICPASQFSSQIVFLQRNLPPQP